MTKKSIAQVIISKSFLLKILFLFLVIFVAVFALGFSDFSSPFLEFISKKIFSINVGNFKITLLGIIKSIAIIIVLIYIIDPIIKLGEKKILSIPKIEKNHLELLIKAFQVSVYFFATIIALNILGIDLMALSVFSGAIGIGVGFGLQKIVANFISGLIILFEGSFKVGDIVEFGDDVYGRIKDTASRFTLVEKFDGKEILIPNEELITNRVINATFSNNLGRGSLYITVPYESDIDKAYNILLECAHASPDSLDNPEPSCFAREFGDSGVKFLILFWVQDIQKGLYKCQSDIIFSILRRFKEEGIPLPYRKIDVCMTQYPDDLDKESFIFPKTLRDELL
jgi:small-conductance mechanosensitive channel